MNWQEVIKWAAIDGAALTNTTTAASLLPAAAKVVLPPGFFSFPGKQLRARASGRISTVVTTPGTMTLDLRLGSTVVFNGGDMTLNIVAKTNVGWLLDVLLTCRAIGAAANLIGQGLWASEAVIGNPLPTAGGAAPHVLPYNAAPAVGNNFDSEASQIVDIFGKWSVANAANSVTLHQFSLSVLQAGT